MLILSRRPNESLVIADNIVITILGVKGTQVRLGITAPRDVVVDRSEVHQRKLAEYDPRHPPKSPPLGPKVTESRAFQSPHPVEKDGLHLLSTERLVDRAEVHARKLAAYRAPSAPVPTGHAVPAAASLDNSTDSAP